MYSSFETQGDVWPEEKALLEKWIGIYDKNGDGKLDAAEFKAAFKEIVNGDEGLENEAFQALSGGQEQISVESILAIKALALDGSQKFIEGLGKIQTTISALSSEYDKHYIKAHVGDTTHARTKLDFKVFLDEEEEKKHFAEAVKGLTFKKEQLGIIIKFHSPKPQEAREKIEKLVKSGLAVLKSTVIRPNSPESNALSTLKFEYTHDDESVTLAIHSEHKGIQIALEYINVWYHHFNFNKIKGFAHFQLGLKNDLSRLHHEDPALRNPIDVVKDGISAQLELNTNAAPLLKRLLRHKFTPDKAIFLAALQKGSRLEIGLDELDLTAFIPKQVLETQFTFDLWELFSDTGRGLVATAKEIGLPIVDNLLDLLENYLLANVHISLNTPHIFAALHFKTSGIKEIWTKLQ